MTPDQRKNNLSTLQSVALKSNFEGAAPDLCSKPLNSTECTSPQLSSHCSEDMSVQISVGSLLMSTQLQLLSISPFHA